METKNIRLKSGLNIHTTTAGNLQNPPLVLLHGWPASGALWRNIIPKLSDSFYVIAPDLPGHGNSDKPLTVKYDLDFLRTFLQEFLDALNLETVHLAAHDLGGVAALSFVARHPERIHKFIIMNTSPYNDFSLRLRFSLFLLRQPVLARFLLLPFVFKQVLKTGIYNHDLITKALSDIFRAPWVKDIAGVRAFSRTIAEPLSTLVEPVDRLKSIKVPTLILWGKKDIFFPFNIARRLHQDLENSTLIGVENAAHFCQEEEPEFIARMIDEFIRSN